MPAVLGVQVCSCRETNVRYLFTVLTHGDHGDVLAETVESFYANVTPAPHRRLVVQDGPAALPPIVDPGVPWACFTTAGGPVGFCKATATMWAAAAACKTVDYVFWLEHDFRFDRPVDLTDLALILDDVDGAPLAQVSLMRGSVNEVERVLGGVVADHRERGSVFAEHVTSRADRDVEWLEHGAYFTTNPCLMRRDFMEQNPWLVDPPRECEGRFGLELVQRGYRFAVAGDGTPWVTHLGVRDGSGY